MLHYFFGDIHGNGYALERCLHHMEELRVDRAYCLGDLVGWLPFGDLTLTRMRSLNFPTVAGNHDLLVAGLLTDYPNQVDRMQASAYNAGLLSTVPGSIDYLLSLPLMLQEEDFIVVHHNPFSLPANEPLTIHSFNYLDQTALKESFESWAASPQRIIFSGHDHFPAVYELPVQDDSPRFEDVIVHHPNRMDELTIRLAPGSRYWVKAGSVGGPYRDGIPKCNTVMYDSSKQVLTLFRLTYPVDRLYNELASHRFCRNLPTLQRYLELLVARE